MNEMKKFVTPFCRMLTAFLLVFSSLSLSSCVENPHPEINLEFKSDYSGVIAAIEHSICGLPDEKFVEAEFPYAMVTRFEFKRNTDGHYRGTFTKIHDGIQMAPLKIG